MLEIVLLRGRMIASIRGDFVPRFAYEITNPYLAIVDAEDIYWGLLNYEISREDAWSNCWERWAYRNALSRETVKKIFDNQNLYPKKRKQ